MVDSRLIITNAEGNQSSFYATTVSRFLGIQSQVEMINGSVLLYNSDPCQAPAIFNQEMTGKIIYITKRGSCTEQVVYENFLILKAAAIIRM